MTPPFKVRQICSSAWNPAVAAVSLRARVTSVLWPRALRHADLSLLFTPRPAALVSPVSRVRQVCSHGRAFGLVFLPEPQSAAPAFLPPSLHISSNVT